MIKLVVISEIFVLASLTCSFNPVCELQQIKVTELPGDSQIYETETGFVYAHSCGLRTLSLCSDHLEYH